MTRNEYMDALKEKLSFMGQDARQATLDFYGEMLDDRMEDGMDERTAVAAMESPEDIAARLRAEQPEEAQKAESAVEPLTDEAMQFSSLADSILKATEKLLDKVPDMVSTVSTAAENAHEEIEKALDGEKTQKAAADANPAAQEKSFGDYEQKILSCPADQLLAVSLTGGEMPVQIETQPGNDVTLIYYTSPDDPYEASVQSGTLTLRPVENKRGAGRFTFSMLGGIIKLGWKQSSPTVQLFLPQDALLDLEAVTSNASIKAKGPQALCDVRLKTSNSRIALKHISCKSMDASSTNARLVLEDVNSRKFLRGETTNARIEASGVCCGGETVLTTTNSRILATDVSAREKLCLATSNSNIQVERLKAEALELKSSNGNIFGSLPGKQSDWRIQSRTSNGRNSLPKEQDGAKPLSVRTSNGSIDLRFEE